MSIQSSPVSSVSGIPAGFGARLKEERKRLKLSQEKLGNLGGVGRLAEIQYEGEVTAPTTRYLALIASAGIDLAYLIFGMRFSEGKLTAAQEARVNEQTIEWIDRYAETQPNQRVSTDTRKALDRIIRSLLRQIELGQLPADFDLMTLISGQASGAEQSKPQRQWTT